MKTSRCDVLVVGSGAAGLRAALGARQAGARVRLVCKGRPGKGTCTIFSGGVFNGDPGGRQRARLEERTLQAGRGLNRRDLVSVLTEDGPRRLEELVRWGMPGVFHQGELHAAGRAPVWGAAIVDCLVACCREAGVTFMAGETVTSLRAEAGGFGVSSRRSADGSQRRTAAGAVVLATGGAGALYQRSDNPRRIVGDGYVLALDAGAVLQDLEFVQFYPLGLAEPGLPPFLIPPSLADAGRLLNDRGENILKKYRILERPAGERARDRLSQAFFNEIQVLGGSVWLELQEITEAQWKVDPFAASTRRILGERYGARYRPVRVAPMAHHVMGGVRIDAQGATDLPGLYAAGEVAGGLHGANRLGGNALTETVVFGARAGEAAARWAEHARPASVTSFTEGNEEKDGSSGKSSARQDTRSRMQELRRLMWTHGGIVRTAEGLRYARGRLAQIREAAAGVLPHCGGDGFSKAHDLWIAVRTGELIVDAALRREESRGAHFREDFPATDDRWLGHLQVGRDHTGRLRWHFSGN